MVHLVRGNLLEANASALVNTVNTVGVMGKGIALQFREAYPGNYRAYREGCDAGEVRLGTMFLHDLNALCPPRYIINFPTKRHWREPSQLEYVDAGLVDLLRVVTAHQIDSIAVPPLGCGNGGLDWEDVRPRIVEALGSLPELTAWVYEPGPPPRTTKRSAPRSRPPMTHGRAVFTRLLDLYQPYKAGDPVGMMEVQKLVYFAQAAGETALNLPFEEGHYGPYADRIHHVLRDVNGHYIDGYRGRDAAARLSLLPLAAESAARYLAGHEDTVRRLDRLIDFVAPFADAYGLELLATVHWLARHDMAVANDPQAAARAVGDWSERKRDRYDAWHISAAWRHLHDTNWMPAANA